MHFSTALGAIERRHCLWYALSIESATRHTPFGSRRRLYAISGAKLAPHKVNIQSNEYAQDICLLINAEPPQWMTGIMEMTRTLGLELIEDALTQYDAVFTAVRVVIFEHV